MGALGRGLLRLCNAHTIQVHARIKDDTRRFYPDVESNICDVPRADEDDDERSRAESTFRKEIATFSYERANPTVG